MVSRLYPLVISVVASSVVTGQDKDRMPNMDHTVDLVSHTCGETTQAKQFNFVSPGGSLETPERRTVLIGEMFQVFPSV